MPNTLNYADQGGARHTFGGAANFSGTVEIAGVDKTAELSAQLTLIAKAGAYTVVAGDDTAGTKAIATGLGAITTFQVTILRSNVVVTVDAVMSASGGTLTVADGGATYALTANDVIHWVAYGTL